MKFVPRRAALNDPCACFAAVSCAVLSWCSASIFRVIGKNAVHANMFRKISDAKVQKSISAGSSGFAAVKNAVW
eukprot:SAG11_NODE_30082_length_304_cov_0.907317_1_plen_73_part_10